MLGKLFIIFSLAGSFIAGAVLYIDIYQPLRLHSTSIDIGQPTIVLDKDGNELFRFAKDKHEPIALQDVPQVMIQAFLAAEDWHFFEHNGISFRGIVRSVIVNIVQGRKAQGASTITQQLVRLLYFDTDKTFSRKMCEQLYAILLERSCTKEQILEAYLNSVYFGLGIYGIQAACQRFFGKSLGAITLDEAALLAGVVCSPRLYCPVWAPLSAKQRRNVVLHQMHKCNFITQDQYKDALEKPVTIATVEKQNASTFHIKDMVRHFVEQRYGKKALYTSGLTVQTTFSSTEQERATKLFVNQCALLRKKLQKPIDGAIVVLDNATGGVRVLVGGYDFTESQFNRAIHAKRQMGSTFKPLVYAAALMEGMTMADIATDEPIKVMFGNQVWEPQNYNNTFSGKMTLAYALSHSINTVTVSTLLAIGAKKVADLARHCRVTDDIPAYPSIALGCVDATLLEVAGLYHMFAYGGIHHDPYYVTCITDSSGAVLYKHVPVQTRVLPAAITSQIVSVLQVGIKKMQASRKQGLHITAEVMSKTGTTNDFRTCWFVGSVPDVTTAVYIGCDDNRSMGRSVFPIESAFPIWYCYMAGIHNHERTRFFVDPSLREITIHERTGECVDRNDSEAISIVV